MSSEEYLAFGTKYSKALLNQTSNPRQLGRHQRDIMMTNQETQTAMEFPPSPAEGLPKQLTDQRQPSCNDLNALSLGCPPKDSASIIAEAKLDTQKNTLNITLSNWNAILVGQSNTEQVSFNHFCDEDRLQADSGPKEEDCSEQQCGITEKVETQLQAFDDESQGCKQPPTSVEILVDIEPQLPLIKRKGYLNGAQCERIMEQLVGLQDNGQFEKHDRLVDSYIKHSASRGNTDMELAMTIERGVAFSYQKKFKQSKRLFTTVINFNSTSKLSNPNILLARAYYGLVQVYRYRKSTKLPMLFGCLEKSEFFLQNHESPDDWAEMYYNYGSLWLAYMSMIPDDERNAQARNNARGKARYYFEMTIESCKKDPRERVQVKKQIYGHLRVATLLLDCTSTVARTQQKVLPPQDIADAIKHLDILEYQLADNIPRGTHVQILKARSDQYYRQGTEMHQLAKTTAQDALRIAENHGFNTELDSLQERIDFLDQLCHDMSRKQRIQPLVGSGIENSSSDASGETSYSETE